MQLHVIDTGLFKLDGGAMFGVVPKQLWKKLNPPDENNLCTWAMRCLLIEEGDRLILIDTGIGDKQSEKFFSHFHPHGDASLLGSLKQKGFSPADITDVVLTHLHFDHVGGAVYRDQNGRLQLTFPNARYWSNEEHWAWAVNPNPREKASFLAENILPIEDSGQLHFVDQGDEIIKGLRIELAHGHTESMIIPHIDYKDKTIVYMADLLPSPHHIRAPYVMGYDVRPLQTMKEKDVFLNTAIQNDYILFYEHDPVNECGLITKTERGFQSGELFKLEEVL